jgi:hypothetical protein
MQLLHPFHNCRKFFLACRLTVLIQSGIAKGKDVVDSFHGIKIRKASKIMET